MMSFPSMVADCWLGLCPKRPVIRTAPAEVMAPPEINPSGLPDGGDGRAATMHRGVNITVSGTKTLVRNRQLLWFPFFTGLVLAGLFIAQFIIRLLSVYPYDAIDFPRWVVLMFIIELVTVLCLNILLAGLIQSLAPAEPGTPPSVREGLLRAGGHLHILADWSVLMALPGTVMSGLLCFSGSSCFTLFPVLRQFPFNFIFLPEVYSTGPIGGTFAMSSAVTWTLILSGINALMFIPTLFVVPLLVLEKKTLSGAVAGTVTLMKRVLGEALICIFLLILVVSVTAATFPLFRIVYSIIAPDMLLIYYPGEVWIAAAVLFIVIVCSLACIASTIAGIVITDLYAYGNTGQVRGGNNNHAIAIIPINPSASKSRKDIQNR